MMQGRRELVRRRFLEWFPFMQTMLDHGAIVFGGVLREMWLGAESSSSLALHMYSYFSRGGDLDCSISYRNFEEATWCDEESLGPLKSVQPVDSSYEITKINRAIDRENQDDFSGDFSIPNRNCVHYQGKLTQIDICPQAGPPLDICVDIIISDTRIEQCDFGCNLLILKGLLLPDINFKRDNCTDLEECHRQIQTRKLRVLDYKAEKNPQKMLHRTSKRLDEGWTIDQSDSIGLMNLAKYFLGAVVWW